MQESHRRGLHPGDGWFSLVEFSHLAATARWSDVGQQGAVPGPTNIQPSLAWKSQLPAYIPPEPWGHLHQPLLMPSTPGVGCTGAKTWPVLMTVPLGTLQLQLFIPAPASMEDPYLARCCAGRAAERGEGRGRVAEQGRAACGGGRPDRQGALPGRACRSSIAKTMQSVHRYAAMGMEIGWHLLRSGCRTTQTGLIRRNRPTGDGSSVVFRTNTALRCVF